MPRDQLIRECLRSTVTAYGSSRASEFRRCEYAHMLKYERGLVPTYWHTTDDGKEPEYFGVGQLVHAGLHYAALGEMGREYHDPLDITRYVAADPNTKTNLGVVYDAERLLAAYASYYGPGIGFDYPVIDAEKFVASDVMRMTETRRIDCVLRVGGQVVLVDHKTRKCKLPDDREQFALERAASPAIVGQSLLAKQHYELDYYPELILNCIIKTKIPKFDRINIVVTERNVSDYMQARTLEIDRQLAGSAIKNLDACAPALGSRCWAWEYCHGTDEQRETYKKGDAK